MTEQEKANDIIYWVKDDIKCLYLVAEVKEQVKGLFDEKYEYWDKVHKIIYNHFVNK